VESLADVDSRAVPDHNQLERFQRPKPFTHGRPAYTERLREVTLGWEAFTGAESARDDQFLELLLDLLRNATTWDWA
jgi:hypothetical protein